MAHYKPGLRVLTNEERWAPPPDIVLPPSAAALPLTNGDRGGDAAKGADAAAVGDVAVASARRRTSEWAHVAC